MNKKTIKIAGWALGLSMAVAGIGLAVGASQKAPMEAKADASYTKVTELDLTTKSYGTSNYNASTTYGDWTIVNGANNNKGWAYFKMGGKSTTISGNNPCYIYSTKASTEQYDKITVHLPAGSLSKNGMSVNSWGLYVYSDKDLKTQIDYVAGETITSSEGTFDFTPSANITWSEGYYYKVSWSLANTTTTNGIVYVDKITCYKESVAIPITEISLGDDVNLHKGESLNLSEQITFIPVNTTQTSYTLTEDSDGEVVSIDGNTITAVAPGDAVVTITSDSDANVTDTINVHVGNKIPTSLSRTKFLPSIQDQTFESLAADSSNNKLTVKYSDNTSDVLTSFSAVEVLLGGEIVEHDYAFQPSDASKSLVYRYSETVDDVEYVISTQSTNIPTIASVLSITEVEANFNGENDYLIVNDDTSYLSVSFVSYDGEPIVSVSSSQSDVLEGAEGEITYNSTTHEGTFNIALDAKAIGMASLTMSFLTENDYELSYVTDSIVVRSDAPVGDTDKYVKVTSTSDLEDGYYLIVSESVNKAFNAGLSTLDATNNYISASPNSSNEITYTATTEAAQVSINYDSTEEKYVIKAAGSDGKYTANVGHSGASNGFDGNNAQNSISFDSNGNATITGSGGLDFGFNSASNQLRFRYFKSAQTAVQLYKFEAAPEPSGFDKALKFVNDYMHTDVSLDNEGSGSCKSSGWYTSAKAAFFDAADPEDTGFHLDSTERLIVKNSFNDYYLRLQKWAIANDEEIGLNDGGTDIILKSSNKISIIFSNGDPTGGNAITTVALISLASVGLVGGYFFLRKKKEN